MRMSTAALAAMIVVLISPASLLAQSSQSTDSSQLLSVPRLINMTGVFRPADGGQPAGVETVTLGIYAEETGGVPVWQETQSIAFDSSGRYTLLLGATEGDGLPLQVFASGMARWLGMTWWRTGEVEGSRTRLTSVPYALKASEAETLGGRPASAYQLALTPGQQEAIRSQTGSDTSAPLAVNAGTPNFLAKYVSGSDVGDSSLFESAGRVGVNTTTPFDIVHSRFLNTNGGLTGFAVQNLGNTATSYSGMLFYDQNGATAQFQGFNNATHEYRINNIARDPLSGNYNGSINFMLGGIPRLLVDPSAIIMSGHVAILAGNASIGLLVGSSGSTGSRFRILVQEVRVFSATLLPGMAYSAEPTRELPSPAWRRTPSPAGLGSSPATWE